MGALALQIVAMVVFREARDIGALFAGRILQGVGTGSALGALGAAMLYIDRERGTRANAVAPGLGSGIGALSSGLIVQYLPAPTRLVYLVFIGVILVQASRCGATAGNQRPQARPACCSRSDSAVIGGLNLFVLSVVSLVTIIAIARLPPGMVMFMGITLLVLGSRSACDLRDLLPGHGLPAIVAGTLVVYGGGLRTAPRDYSLFVVTFAVATLLTLLRTRGGGGSVRRGGCSCALKAIAQRAGGNGTL